MKIKQLGLILLIAVAFAACKPKDSFVIDGTFQNTGAEKKVFLYGMQSSNMVAIDSTNLSEKGEFKFIRKTPSVDFFRVSIGNHEFMLIAKNGDNIKLEADLADKTLAYKISGANEVDKLSELNALRNKFAKEVESIQKDFDAKVAAQPQNRAAILDAMRPQYESYIKQLNNDVIKFASDNKGTLASFYAMNTLSPQEYEAELVKFSDEIKDQIKGNATVDTFVKQMQLLKAVQVGQPAPTFTMDTADGKAINLTDYKGKYVLLDFWASWCQPCRQENPNVVKVYNKFKTKNFDILGISLDTDKAVWLGAVKADGLAWQHVCELKDFNGETVRKYQVQAIPSSFLIDPSGKIVAKNLRGEELEAFLSKILL
ncbi:TlpA disulfide reductase family protein [Pedobacter punctiformis]|uniref:TlpA disulfide reductase family protein n=1 Tax=Pedobacter punctiformis TaxID=3004097 RepID=A0ABT4L708_9SPHI|nr:TlpA disulfide reductase family protein [Pedobacter sp. HCMS5-2]MCZ4243702.1 TlpA disulfide reductase family protein [Pedobacter sp. HCMS5-2]